MNEQIMMGIGLALISFWGLVKVDWFRENSRYGQWFVSKLGSETARRVLQGLMLTGILLGALLALNIIQPLRWEPQQETQSEGPIEKTGIIRNSPLGQIRVEIQLLLFQIALAG
ncbi:MAG: hypothetical protein R3C11_05955 [Planctomycetaceae bacterium]